jgi:RimJ/RimL family protein N-acetyltransferase
MMFPEQITTERLLLRWPVEADAPEIFARYAQDPEVTRYLTWRPHTSLQETLEFQRKSAADRAEGKVCSWLIRLRERHEVLGMIGLGIEKHVASLGYCLARDAWGRGYATEAAQAVVALARENESLWRIQASCHVDNTASGRVLEKAGLVFEGTLRRQSMLPNLSDAPSDVRRYATVRDAEGIWD